MHRGVVNSWLLQQRFTSLKVQIVQTNAYGGYLVINWQIYATVVCLHVTIFLISLWNSWEGGNTATINNCVSFSQ